MQAIGVDPSLTATGLARIVDGAVTHWAVVKSKVGSNEKATPDLARRLHDLAVGVRRFVADTGGPAVFCVEAQVGASMGRSGMGSTFKLGAAYGAVLASSPYPPLVVPPAEVKRRLRGKGEVSKDEIRNYCVAHVRGRHPAEPKSKADREAVWDAAAVAIAMEPELERLAALAGG